MKVRSVDLTTKIKSHVYPYILYSLKPIKHMQRKNRDKQFMNEMLNLKT